MLESIQGARDAFSTAQPLAGDLGVEAMLSRCLTGGVLNTNDLAQALVGLAENDPLAATGLFASIAERLSPVDQRRLTDDTSTAAAKSKSPSISDFKLDGATAQDKKDLQASIDYLSKTKLGAQVIATAEKQHVTIHIIHDGNDRAQGKEIWWDPKSALVTTKGGVQSPALGLVHELAHTQANPKTPIRDLNNDYDNTEERRVITLIETPIARLLGEGLRFDHRGDLKEVSSPTYHEANPAAK